MRWRQPSAFCHPSGIVVNWNIYGVDILPDALVFHINGIETFRYPRVEAIDGQYPFYLPMYLLIDMQIQGAWVGKADPDTLPVKMEIDWIRHYLPAIRG